MIALHERFGKEGIEINYPVRKLIIDKTEGIQDLENP